MDAGAQPIFLVAPYGHPYEKKLWRRPCVDGSTYDRVI